MAKPGFKQTEIGEIPEEWELVKFSERCLIIKGKKPQKIYEEQIDGSKPYLLVEHMSGGQKFYTDDQSVPVCNEQDTLLIMDGSRSGLVFTGYAGAIGSTFGAVRPKDEMIISRFVYYFLQTKYSLLQTHRTKGAIPHVDKQILRRMPFPLPPLPEQKKIASVLSTIDAAIEKTSEIIEQAKQLKKGLMQELLTRGIGHTKFKQTEIGEIPEEWEVVSLEKCLMEICSGFRPKGGVGKLTEGIPSIGGEHITIDGKLDFSSIKYISEEFFEEMPRGHIRQGDILLVKDGATIGKLALMAKMPFDKMAVNEHVYILRSNERLSPAYLYYVLASHRIQSSLQQVQTGSAQPGLNSSFVRHLDIQLPPLPEQKKIAEILGAADAKIEAEVQKREQLQTLKKGLMQDLLTGRVRFPEFVKGVNYDRKL